MFTNISTKEEFSIEQLDSNNSKYKLNINKYINKRLGLKSASQNTMFFFVNFPNKEKIENISKTDCST